jgi:hypothetical protein
MRELTRDEMLDRLPELLHGTLSADVRAQIDAALRDDPQMADELETLRTVMAGRGQTPPIDIARIVAALPAPPAVITAAVPVDQLAERRAAKRPWISTRFARAAALLVVVGGGTLVSVLGRDGTAPAGGADVVAESSAAAVQTGLALGAPIDELSMEQLQALEAEIKALDGVPSDEPDGTAELLAGEGA